ncbi:MAG: thioredoxin domain-containing protein, partial [Clostridiaceae bacterium]|nr:thioredoxin domain-containing protein [Clostridiaceae bacterium]
RFYDITDEGNFEGFNIPNLIKNEIPAEEKDNLDSMRKKLFEYRERRIHPYKDDKILTSWNGLMIAAMACGGRILGDDKYTFAAEKAAEFILSKLVRDDGRLLARYRDGEAAYPAYVDDYAFIIWGLIELYETTYKPQYLKKALSLNDDLIRLFWDSKNGGLFLYGNDSEELIVKPKEIYDGATPSGNSVATLNFLRLARLTGQHELEELANKQFSLFGKNIGRMARGHAFLLTALLFSQSKSREVVLVGNNFKDTESMVNIIRQHFSPFTLSMLYSEQHTELKDLAPYVENYKPLEGKATAYICENFSCKAPITDNTKFMEAISN